MTLTDEMAKVMRIIEKTDDLIYITGKAGTGKTTFLKYLASHTSKRSIITAPTGVAAINAGGTTLHSFLGIPFGVLTPDMIKKSRFSPRKQMLCNCIDLLIIDEISMVRADVIDFINAKLKMYRRSNEPFGGIQVVMFGDLHQLPPVVKRTERDILDEIYLGPYFFNAKVFQEKGFHIIELSHVFRQSDEKFINVLNNIRDYKMTPDDINVLEEVRDRKESQNFDNGYIHICSHKEDVTAINSELLRTPTHEYKAELGDDFNENAMPCDALLQLRVGARVMTLVNDPEKRYYNGSLGYVTTLSDDSIGLRLDNGYEVELGRYTWEACEYQMEKGEMKKVVKGTCCQFPVSLAWAITIHKSQGLTFDKIAIHSKHMFCSGQLYVALSRCRSLEGIVSDSFISKRMILPDKELSNFETAYKQNNNYFDVNTYNSMLK